MLAVPTHHSPAARGISPGWGQYVGGRPVIDRMTWDEILGLRYLVHMAALGCLHENQSRTASELMRDEAWLGEVIAARARHMAGGGHG